MEIPVTGMVLCVIALLYRIWLQGHQRDQREHQQLLEQQTKPPKQEPNAKVNKPKQYSKDGLEFRYPGNWKVTEDVRQADLRYLIVETPGDAILVIQIIPDKLAVSLKESAQVFSDNARKATPIGKITPSTFGVPQMAGGFEVIKGKFSISVLGVITPHTQHFRRKQIGNEVCFLISQAASEDYLKVSTGVDQVINSFKYENLLE